MWWYILLACVSVLFYIYGVKPLKYWQNENVKYIRGWPLFGNFAGQILKFESFPDLVLRLYRQFPDERYVGYTQLLTPVLLIRDLDLLRDITIKDFEYFTDHNTTDVHDVDPLWSRNLSLLSGKRWKDMRVKLSPTFTLSKMRAMFQLMQDCGKQFTDHLHSEVGDDFATYNMKDILSRFANDVIASCAFGVQKNSLKDRDNAFFNMGASSFNLRGWRGLRFLLLISNPNIAKFLKIPLFSTELTNYFRKIIFDNIHFRERTNLVRPDMIHLLIKAKRGLIRHESKDEEIEDAGFATVNECDLGIGKSDISLTNEDIAAQALIFFFAGYDSVSTVLCFLCQELAMNLDIQHRLQLEIDTVSHRQPLTYEDIVKLKYLDMVISEGLRKWPAGTSVDRKCTKDYIIQPRRVGEKPLIVRKGTILAIPIYGIHRDEKYYMNADKFDPERFDVKNRKNIVPYSYLPFNHGPRSCIANRFALLELKVLVFSLLSKFDLGISAKTQLNIKLDPSDVNPAIKGGFWLGIKRRTKKC